MPEARAKCDDADVDYAMLVDEKNRPQGWLSERAFTGEPSTYLQDASHDDRSFYGDLASVTP